MKIAAVETVRIAARPNVLWVRVETDAGPSGLGETFFLPGTVETYLHEHLAPRVIGRDPLAIDRLAVDLRGYIGMGAPGAEMRGNSAFDIALWDLWGHATGQPIAQLLGGMTRDAIRTYNTCAGPDYIKRADGQRSENFGLGSHPLDDLDAFLHRADELACDLLEEGITAMKIWPFDMAAERAGGLHIGAAELRAALRPFERIRTAVGDRIDIMVEFHSLWQLTPAIRIARALEPFDTYWHEDPIRMDGFADLRRYADASPAPVCASETLAGRSAFRDLLEVGAAGVVMLDLGWCGGLSEARKIAAMAEAWHLPVAPHDCTGPVVLAASTHLSLNAPNALVQESVRAFLRGWYGEVAVGLPNVSGGLIAPAPGPGHGVSLHADLDRRHDVLRRRTTAADL
ncbi:MAG: mandelate racemase/muconate lactonizing enzyme family protein [Shimia sp.]